MVDQHAPHRARGGAQEVGAVGEAARVVAEQPQPRFVHEPGRVERVGRTFAGHRAGRDLPQVAVEQVEQLVGSQLVAGPEAGEAAGHVAR